MLLGQVATGTAASSESQILESLGECPNPSMLTSYPKRKFGKKSPVFRSFQSSWYKRWAWVHYDQAMDVAFCFTCLKAKRNGILKCSVSKADEAILSRGYSNWKDVNGKYGKDLLFIRKEMFINTAFREQRKLTQHAF